jgi:hypothetical protein
MANQQIRSPDRTVEPIPIGICYFVGRRTQGEEVKFPQPPVAVEAVEQPLEPLAYIPVRERPYWFPAASEAHWWIGRFIVGTLFFLFFAVPAHFVMIAVKHAYPPPPQELVPPEPTFGQSINGKVAGKPYHWVYFGPYGWIDP